MSDKEKVPRQRGRVENVGGGRYKVTVYVGLGSDGKRLYHRKTLRNSTEAKARKYARDIASQAERGDYFAPPKVTLGQLFDDALERWRRNGLQQTTLEARERHVRLHALPALGADTQIGKLTTAALQGFYDRLLDGGYKPSSVRLGHVSVEFTQDEYVDALPAMQRRAADNLESKLLRTQLAPFEGGREM